mmetsp:Transcript_125148/g.359393  ORF Transcript_125148/g.359393 Transcript_125148/m.359393 type:complete len:170 (-) Transcript_125148:15-524(-)
MEDHDRAARCEQGVGADMAVDRGVVCAEASWVDASLALLFSRGMNAVASGELQPEPTAMEAEEGERAFGASAARAGAAPPPPSGRAPPPGAQGFAGIAGGADFIGLISVWASPVAARARKRRLCSDLALCILSRERAQEVSLQDSIAQPSFGGGRQALSASAGLWPVLA